LLADLLARLRESGHDITVVSAGGSYAKRTHFSASRGKNELAALLSIFWKSLWIKRPDVILAFSSPACLVVAAAALSLWHHVTLLHWALDLYPDLAIHLGALRPSPFSGFLRWLMRRSYHRCATVVTLDPDMQRYLKEQYDVESEIITPWPPAVSQIALTTTTADWIWLYSGNLGRAHEWRALIDAQRILEKNALPVTLVFQGGGPAKNAAQEASRDLQRCHWKEYAPQDELLSSLLQSRILIVTQKTATQGQLWPSKLALVQLLPVPILWVGPTEGFTPGALRKSPQNGVFDPAQAPEIAEWIEEKFRSGKPTPINTREIISKIKAARSQGLDKWEKIISRLSP
jgi:hypothetical protein